MGAQDTVKLLLDGIEWAVEAPYADALARDFLGAVPDLATHPQATLVKRSLQRTVYRVALADGSRVIVKVYHVRGWKERVKRLLFGPKPQIEWAASHRVLALGIPASHAIAVGRPSPPSDTLEGYLVIEVLPDITTLGSYLRTLAAAPDSDPRAAARRVLHELAAFVRRLHDRGVSHHDLHLGNILARASAPSADQRFLIVDLHRIRAGRPPSPRHRASAIAQLLHGLSPGLALDLRAAAAEFLDAYAAAGAPLASSHLSTAAILAAMARRAAKRLDSRARRCLANSTQFAVEHLSGWRIYHRRDHSAEDILALWTRHREAAPPTVARLPDGLELRQYPRRGILARLLARSPAVRDYAAAHRAHTRGATGGPQAIAAAECLRGPDRGRSFALLACDQGLQAR
ncbi:MAG TPA: lipopolysaccharide kinase InaA family protein [Planctomycetota bacterium]|nr:lipopolysaccharide kinase InaA family protein [Planctomycetota bacterium]